VVAIAQAPLADIQKQVLARILLTACVLALTALEAGA